MDKGIDRRMRNQDLDNLYLTEKEQKTETEGSYIEPSSRNFNRKSRKKKKAPFWLGIILGILGGAVLTVGITVGVSASAILSGNVHSAMTYQEKIAMIVQYLSYYYLNDFDDQMIEDGAAKGIMSNIGDKYAEYYTADEFEDFLDDMNGEYAGIGVSITLDDDGSISVYKVFEGTPAQEAGIHVRDLIVEAAGERDFETLDDLVALVRGEEGTYVDIVIERDGEEIPMTVERRKIETESVACEMLDDSIGYIQIAEFNSNTADQFEAAIESLLAEGMTSVIFDVRDNPGGDYDTVVSMCDMLLPEGPIVTVKDKAGAVHTDNSDADCLDMPMVVLTNGNSASAAELFTMALSDYGVASIVGNHTYGKGIVQSIFMLEDGSGLKFTTERYYGPNGNCIQDTGIEPDYVVDFPEEAYADGVIYREEDTQLKYAMELLGGTWPYEEVIYDNTGSEEEQ